MAQRCDVVPLSDYRTCLDEYLRGVAAPFASVAGRIIEERLPAGYARDPLRPCLVLWACAACGGDRADALPVAAAFDLFDRFLLLHDELADDSAEALARWGLGQSLNAGDALYALGFRSLAAGVRHPQHRLAVAKLVGEAVLRAIEHRAAQCESSAALTSAALAAGARLAGAPDGAVEAFARAGSLLAAAAEASDPVLAQQAAAALAPWTAPENLDAFEEVARYVARKAA